jgi:hypothetical protein
MAASLVFVFRVVVYVSGENSCRTRFCRPWRRLECGTELIQGRKPAFDGFDVFIQGGFEFVASVSYGGKPFADGIAMIIGQPVHSRQGIARGFFDAFMQRVKPLETCFINGLSRVKNQFFNQICIIHYHTPFFNKIHVSFNGRVIVGIIVNPFYLFLMADRLFSCLVLIYDRNNRCQVFFIALQQKIIIGMFLLDTFY